MIDGGPGAVPLGRLDAWLVTDERAELIGSIRKLAGAKGLVHSAGAFRQVPLWIERLPVIHTSHPTFGYRIRAQGHMVVWAPEFRTFPGWARGADLMFSEGAAWNRAIRFTGGVGGHMDVLSVARRARRLGIRRLVFAHLGRPTLRALSDGLKPPFGHVATDGQVFVIRPVQRRRASFRTRTGSP